jgi:carboxylesterase type B
MESGAPTSRAVRYPDAPVHESQWADLLKGVDCPDGLSNLEIFEYLRSLPISKVADAQAFVFEKYNRTLQWAFQPVIDGVIIRQPPIDAWQSGKWHKVPILTGFTTNEGSLYVDKTMSTGGQFTDFWRTLLPKLEESDIGVIDQLYPNPELGNDTTYKETRQDLGVGDMYKRIEAAYAQYAYVAPVRQTAHLASEHVPVYMYHWALEGDIVNGARHGDNLFYETKQKAKCDISKSQADLAGIMHAYITSFICRGDPNALEGEYKARTKWPAYDANTPQVMIFAEHNKELVGGTIGPPALLEEDSWAKVESDFWWSKVRVSQQ